MEFLTGDAAKNARTEIVRRGLLKCSLCNSKASKSSRLFRGSCAYWGSSQIRSKT